MQCWIIVFSAYLAVEARNITNQVQTPENPQKPRTSFPIRPLNLNIIVYKSNRIFEFMSVCLYVCLHWRFLLTTWPKWCSYTGSLPYRSREGFNCFMVDYVRPPKKTRLWKKLYRGVYSAYLTLLKRGGGG